MRQCGECQLCCRVLPIIEIGKKANERCSYAKFGKGCTLHGQPSKPLSCQRWNCFWLVSPAFDLPRPDRAGYVVDIMPDVVVFGEDVFTGKKVDALQIWADPRRPEAWRGAMDWIKSAIGDKEAVAVVRFGPQTAITVVPPCLSDTGDWREVESRLMRPVEGDTVKRMKTEERIEAALANVSRETPEPSHE